MSLYGGNGEFGGMYGNPKMGGTNMGSYYGGTQQDQWNQGQWELQQQRGPGSQSIYSAGGFDPNNPFGTTYTSSNSLSDPFMMTPQMREAEQARMGDAAYNTWYNSDTRDFLDPSSMLRGINIGGTPFLTTQAGTRTINPDAMQGMFGTSGASGGVPAGYEGTAYQAPGEWGGYEFDVSQLDPNKAIEAWEPYMEEQRGQGFAEAANRMGQSGMNASTPYSEALGGVARKSADDTARIAAEYQYRAQESMAQRDLQRQMAEQQAGLQAWGTQGGWQHQGQMGDQAQDFGAWQQEGNWQMEDNWQNAQNQQQQQNMMMQMLGSFMGG